MIGEVDLVLQVNETDLQEITCTVKFVKRLSIHKDCRLCDVDYATDINNIDFCSNCKDGVVWKVKEIERI